MYPSDENEDDEIIAVIIDPSSAITGTALSSDVRYSDDEIIACIIDPFSAITGTVLQSDVLQFVVRHSDDEIIAAIIDPSSAITGTVLQSEYQDQEMSIVFDDDISTFLEFMDGVFVNDISIDDIVNYDCNDFMFEDIFLTFKNTFTLLGTLLGTLLATLLATLLGTLSSVIIHIIRHIIRITKV